MPEKCEKFSAEKIQVQLYPLELIQLICSRFELQIYTHLLVKCPGFVPRISWKTATFQKVSIKYYKYVKGTTLAFLLKVFLSNWSHENLIYCQLFGGKSTQSCFSWQWEVSLSQRKICFSIISCFLNTFHIYLCLPLFLLHGDAALTQLLELAWLHTGAAIEFQKENPSSLCFFCALCHTNSQLHPKCIKEFTAYDKMKPPKSF